MKEYKPTVWHMDYDFECNCGNRIYIHDSSGDVKCDECGEVFQFKFVIEVKDPDKT